MGGLFSREEPPSMRSYTTSAPTYCPSNTLDRRQELNTQRSAWNQWDDFENFVSSQNYIYGTSTQRLGSSNRNITSNNYLTSQNTINATARHSAALKINIERSLKNPLICDTFASTKVVTFTLLAQYDPEYLKVTRMITNKKNFKVDNIEKIENPYLLKAYQLKKEEKLNQFPYLQERLLFHGTKQSNVDEICKMNFNWRLCQTHKYGKGVSFSPNSTYASNYSDKYVRNKVMIVAKVLIGKSCAGDEFMVIPPDGYDTSHKGDEQIVIVKYEDNEFCPVYKINYHLVNENVGKGNRNRKPRSRRGVGLGFDFDF